ncbi:MULTISPECIES: GTPase-associated system all-helical protein GASH [unclassified Nocardioides]|uniref:GTPase-associated system all-helical protein GASH n=1 Tax=unclassified Nocardioides TaxID=2615069 RepID=UPI0030142A1A
MTTHEPASTMLAAWLQPVLPIVNEGTIELARSWVTALAVAEDAYIEDLARAAFGKADPAQVRTLETSLAAATSTYAPEGKTELIAHLSAAALIHLLEEESAASAAIASRCESLLFLGWTPVLAALPERVRATTEASARKVRERVVLDATIRAPRKRSAEAGAELDETDKLAATLNDVHNWVGRVVDRIDAVVGQFNERLDLLDEEVDALWWARSGTSSTTGEVWTDLPALRRTVMATTEVTTIVGPHPPTAGTLTVLDQVIAAGTDTFTLTEAVAALQETGWTAPTPDNAREVFRPLATGIAFMVQFSGNTTVVTEALAASLDLPEGHVVSASALARQILNEHAQQGEDD